MERAVDELTDGCRELAFDVCHIHTQHMHTDKEMSAYSDAVKLGLTLLSYQLLLFKKNTEKQLIVM